MLASVKIVAKPQPQIHSWKNTSTHRAYFEHVERKLDFATYEQWYSMRRVDFLKNRGAHRLLDYYEGSLTKALLSIFPERNWKEWKFPHTPFEWWKGHQNQRKFLDDLGKELSVNSFEDWYKVGPLEIVKRGGQNLYQKIYDNSMFKCLSAVYPEYPWDPDMFSHVNQGYWHKVENQRRWFDDVAKRINIKEPSDWYNISYAKIIDEGGGKILVHYGNSLFKALTHIYPEHTWYPWKFARTSRGHWTKLQNHREFFDSIATQLNVQRIEDWYRVSAADVCRLGGTGVLNDFYGNSVYRAMCAVYPEYNWLPWNFIKLPENFWNNNENVITYLKWLGEQLGVRKLDDWHYVSRSQVSHSLVVKYGGLIPLLSRFYPHHEWNEKKAHKWPSKAQIFLRTILDEIFPGEDKLMDYRHSAMTFTETNREMELDIFIPSLSLAFEYQGQQHYLWSKVYGPPVYQQARDAEKRDFCKKLGVTLIEVPFWWDRTKYTLMATIHRHRPDLVDEKSGNLMKPIAEQMPAHILKRYKSLNFLENIDFVMFKVWRGYSNPVGMMLSEFVNGIRCIWDGKEKFLTEFGSDIHIPESLIPKLPQIPLDGMLHMGPNSFDLTVAIARGSLPELWEKELKLRILDLPSKFHMNFAERMKYLQENAAVFENELLELPHVHKCASKEQFLNLLAQSGDEDFEQLLIHKPGGFYLEDKTTQIVRNEITDHAQVIRNADKGVFVRRLDGSEYFIPTLSYKNIDVGSTVMVRFQADRGTHVNPFIVQPLNHVKWQQLLKNEAMGYTIGVGHPGVFPTCRGCKRVLRDRKELRVEIRGAFTPLGQTQPYPTKYSVCFNIQCIQKAHEKLKKKRLSGVYLPPFENKIGVPAMHYDEALRSPGLGHSKLIVI